MKVILKIFNHLILPFSETYSLHKINPNTSLTRWALPSATQWTMPVCLSPRGVTTPDKRTGNSICPKFNLTCLWRSDLLSSGPLAGTAKYSTNRYYVSPVVTQIFRPPPIFSALGSAFSGKKLLHSANLIYSSRLTTYACEVNAPPAGSHIQPPPLWIFAKTKNFINLTPTGRHICFEFRLISCGHFFVGHQVLMSGRFPAAGFLLVCLLMPA